MLSSPWIAALLALFVWWFSTGAILWVVKRTDGREGPIPLAWASLPVAALGIAGFWASLSMVGVAGAYLGFLSALAIWGWVEFAFLTGAVTGPNREACPPQAAGPDRLARAWGTVAHHEILLAATMLALVIFANGAANLVGLWTFGVLFVARISAKLNLFFGVPRIHTEFLPTALSHVPSHFRKARLNFVFPVSVTLLSFATACWLERLIAAETPAGQVGFALLAALTALALLEHWLMVLPLPDEKLWRWMMPAPNTDKTTAR